MADDQRLNEQMDQLLNHPALRMQRSVIVMFGLTYCGVWRLDWGPFWGQLFWFMPLFKSLRRSSSFQS